MVQKPLLKIGMFMVFIQIATVNYNSEESDLYSNSEESDVEG